MKNEKIFYNAVANILGGDYKKINRLFTSKGTWENSFKSLGKNDELPQNLWRQLESLGVGLVLKGERDYPALLGEIPLPPFGIYFLGNIPKVDEISLAIVGTRKVTPDGEDLAHEFAKILAGRNINIISGLAFGVDSAAHRGALTAGRTCAVLATAVDNPTPATNKRLAEEILAKGGALISEYPPGSPAFAHRFLERNRIVSGLCRAVILIEAPERSGSLATARFAMEQNRDVFVVPGPAVHRNYKGSHALIREGARLATSAAEVLEDLGFSQKKISLFEGTPEEQTVLATITDLPNAGFDEIAETVKLDPALLSQILNSLLIAEQIEETPNGYKII
ncbi:MAG: DNA processing protein [Parcubacteria group bacterium LiPW_15]|nr:MAG: DNA processing protein [Parcubacteria group bacterium LiPW_15]